MDQLPVIARALVAGALLAAQPGADVLVLTAYARLKELVSLAPADTGRRVELVALFLRLEKNPDDPAGQSVLVDELRSARIEPDAGIAQLAQALLAAIKQIGATSYSAKASGGSAVAQGDGAVAAGPGAVIIRGGNSGNINTGAQYFGAGLEHEADDVLGVNDGAKRLARLLDQYFDEEELKVLAFDLDLDWDNLQGRTKSTKARAIVLRCEKQGKGDDLKRLVLEARPNLRGKL